MSNEGMHNFRGDDIGRSALNTPEQPVAEQPAFTSEQIQSPSFHEDINAEIPPDLIVDQPQTSEQLQSPQAQSSLGVETASESTTKIAQAVLAPEQATDGDKMEKEWTQQTAKMIDTYQGDPNKLEEVYEGLQDEYLAKRFNRHIGDRNL